MTEAPTHDRPVEFLIPLIFVAVVLAFVGPRCVALRWWRKRGIRTSNTVLALLAQAD